jgi:hypothetical protein
MCKAGVHPLMVAIEATIEATIKAAVVQAPALRLY